MSVSSSIAPGALLCDRYRVLEEIGRDVAVKTLDPTLGRDPSFVQRFSAEARAIGRLNHPHVVPLFDVGLQDGQPFMVLQLVDGPSTRSWCKTLG